MARYLTLAATALAAAGPAFAQTGDGDWRLDVEAVLVASGVEGDGPLAPAADSVMASVLVEASRADTFENGLTLTWRGAVAYERDAPARPAFAGVLGACPTQDPPCPRVPAGAVLLSPVSPATGLASAGLRLDEDGFATLERASVSFEWPEGEVVLGADAGAATMLDARAPSVLTRASAVSSGLDPTGLSVTRARNDVAGNSLKATYLSPRWLGFRLGASYAPEANLRSRDFDPEAGGVGLAGAELEEVWEGAVSFARQFADQDLRVRAGVTYVSARSGAGLAAFSDYESWGAGLELEHDGWTGGVRWLSGNNAWTSGGRDYEAWEAGLVREVGDWRLGVEGGWARDGLTGLEGMSWLAGASRKINENLSVALAWAASDADLPVAAGPSLGHVSARNDGLLVELTVRN